MARCPKKDFLPSFQVITPPYGTRSHQGVTVMPQVAGVAQFMSKSPRRVPQSSLPVDQAADIDRHVVGQGTQAATALALDIFDDENRDWGTLPISAAGNSHLLVGLEVPSGIGETFAVSAPIAPDVEDVFGCSRPDRLDHLGVGFGFENHVELSFEDTTRLVDRRSEFRPVVIP